MMDVAAHGSTLSLGAFLVGIPGLDPGDPQTVTAATKALMGAPQTFGSSHLGNAFLGHLAEIFIFRLGPGLSRRGGVALVGHFWVT
jgi:hypothetical protein